MYKGLNVVVVTGISGSGKDFLTREISRNFNSCLVVGASEKFMHYLEIGRSDFVNLDDSHKNFKFNEFILSELENATSIESVRTVLIPMHLFYKNSYGKNINVEGDWLTFVGTIVVIRVSENLLHQRLKDTSKSEFERRKKLYGGFELDLFHKIVRSKQRRVEAEALRRASYNPYPRIVEVVNNESVVISDILDKINM